jgi:6,7-dimethyl-8-ribityllumazine synthase
MSRLSPEPAQIDGADFKVAIVAARYNQVYVDGLLEGVLSALAQSGVPDEQVDI